MSESNESAFDYTVDLAGAVFLGLFTAAAAFAAYQAALWGGNQATAYTEAINILGDANREALRGSQDQAFDTTVWIEHLKAKTAAQKEEATREAAEAAAAAGSPAPEGAVPAAAPEADDDEPVTKEEAAKELAEELAYAEDEPLVKQLGKLQQSRRDLVAATKWASGEHEKRTKKLPPAKRLELATKLVELGIKSEQIDTEYAAVLEKLDVLDADETEIEAALAKDPAAKERIAQLEKDSLATAAAIEAEMDQLAPPMFYESPTYVRAKQAKYEELVKKGQETFLNGQNCHPPPVPPEGGRSGFARLRCAPARSNTTSTGIASRWPRCSIRSRSSSRGSPP